jgi:hypothetical protein
MWDTLYLTWLRAQIPEEPLCLIMDQYTTHTALEIEEEAEELEIKIIWAPKSGTGRYYTLDWRTFATLKSEGKAKWR